MCICFMQLLHLYIRLMVLEDGNVFIIQVVCMCDSAARACASVSLLLIMVCTTESQLSNKPDALFLGSGDYPKCNVLVWSCSGSRQWRESRRNRYLIEPLHLLGLRYNPKGQCVEKMAQKQKFYPMRRCAASVCVYAK